MKKESTEKNKLWLYLLLAIETVAVIALIIYAGSLSKDNKELETFKQQQAELTEAELTETEVQQIASAMLDKYTAMGNEFFMTCLKTKGKITSEDWVTINDVGGYVEVMDERFDTIQDVKDYIATICTKEYAEELCEKNWDLSGERPFLAEQDGKLYTQIADGPAVVGEAFIPLATVNSDGEIEFVYWYVDEDDGMKYVDEKGTIVLEEKDGNWYVKSATEWR